MSCPLDEVDSRFALSLIEEGQEHQSSSQWSEDPKSSRKDVSLCPLPTYNISKRHAKRSVDNYA